MTLDASRLGRIDPASLTTTTFTVHAKATSPIPLATGDVMAQVVLDQLFQQPAHGAACRGDLLKDLRTVGVAFDGPFDRAQLTGDPPHAGDELLLVG